MPSATEFGSIVAAMATSCEPSNETEPLKSPVKPIVRGVKKVFAVNALPLNSAVTSPALKCPFSSRITIVFAVLFGVAFELTSTTAASPAPETVIPVPTDAEMLAT